MKFGASKACSLCTIFTILLTLWNSEPKKLLKIKLFGFSSDFDETWWSCSIHMYYKFTKFHQIRMKNKKVLFIDRLTEVSSIKVPLRLGEFGLRIKKSEKSFSQDLLNPFLGLIPVRYPDPSLVSSPYSLTSHPTL